MNKTIIIADDHPLFRAALITTLKQDIENLQIREAGSVTALQNLLELMPSPNLILLDLHMPGAQGFSGLIYLKGHHPSIPVVVVSALEDDHVILNARQHHADGFIPKSSCMMTLKDAVSKVLAGGQWFPEGLPEPTSSNSTATLDIEEKLGRLTPQQFRVLGMITEGLLNKQIAYELDVSEATIKAHVTAIFKKLEVRSRTQAVIAMKALTLSPADNGCDAIQSVR